MSEAFKALARKELARRQSARQEPSVSGGEALARGFSSSVINNALGVPNYIANTVKDDIQGFFSGLNPFRELPDPNTEGTYPPLVKPPVASAADVFGGAQRMGEGVGAIASGDFSQFQQGSASENQALLNQQAAEQRPGMFTIGETGGDVAALVAGKTPLAGARNQMGNAISASMREAAKVPGLPGVINTAALKIAKSHLPRGIARATEAGLEGAVLSIMDGNDPYEVAGLAAGSQVFGSLAITGGKHLTKNLGAALVLGGVALNYLNMLPGGDSGIIDAFQASATKVLPTIGLGLLAGMAGYGRAPQWMQDKVPEIADAISTIPRGAITSLIQEAWEERERGENNISLVLQKYSSNPEYFGSTAARRLERAITTEGVSVKEAIDSLMDNKEFRERFNEL